MLPEYDDTCVPKPTMTWWPKMFSDYRQETGNLPWSSQAHKVVIEKLVTDIDTAYKRKDCGEKPYRWRSHFFCMCKNVFLFRFRVQF
ncbi:hypothetical protein TNCT_501931 [Trichonephila clavata]|uniref:Uncharacterized protein n=1 Tax=Trichonephila clavata TaxID=2740835 RepID=A0A8X6FVR9_TRICU|nr:hypothetical protein TNCT_501931 [Trichonephila clavata]